MVESGWSINLKLYPSVEAFYETAQKDPRKAWKTGFKIMKKEKCISKGVTIGGDNADVYMPQFISSLGKFYYDETKRFNFIFKFNYLRFSFLPYLFFCF